MSSYPPRYKPRRLRRPDNTDIAIYRACATACALAFVVAMLAYALA